jgi:hypothetical protein
MSEESGKRKRAEAAVADVTCDSSLCTVIVPRSRSRPRLEASDVSKLARCSSSASVFGLRCAFGAPKVRRVRTSNQPLLCGPPPTPGDQPDLPSLKERFQSLRCAKGSAEMRSCADQGQAPPGSMPTLQEAVASGSLRAEVHPGASQLCIAAPGAAARAATIVGSPGTADTEELTAERARAVTTSVPVVPALQSGGAVVAPARQPGSAGADLKFAWHAAHPAEVSRQLVSVRPERAPPPDPPTAATAPRRQTPAAPHATHSPESGCGAPGTARRGAGGRRRGRGGRVAAVLPQQGAAPAQRGEYE